MKVLTEIACFVPAALLVKIAFSWVGIVATGVVFVISPPLTVVVHAILLIDANLSLF